MINFKIEELKPHIWAVAGILFVVILIFHSVLLPPKPLLAQDAPLVSEKLNRQRASSGDNVYWNTVGYLGIGGGVISADKVKYYIDFAHLKRFFPVTLVNTFNFPFAVLIVGIAFYLFCLSLDLKPLSAFTGAVSIMLAGHFISCTYSGHTGKFFMLAYLSLALWLLTAGIKKRSIIYLLDKAAQSVWRYLSKAPVCLHMKKKIILCFIIVYLDPFYIDFHD